MLTNTEFLAVLPKKEINSVVVVLIVVDPYSIYVIQVERDLSLAKNKPATKDYSPRNHTYY